MKFKKYLSWTLPLIVSIAALPAIQPAQTPKKIPENPGKNAPELVIKTDTIHLRTKQDLQGRALGTFYSNTNTLYTYYFIADTDDKDVIAFCKRQNELRPMTLRHEFEHARKAILTKKTREFPPYIRAQIAAFNEIVAPASEIIEALEYSRSHNMKLPPAKKFVIDACNEIFNTSYNPALLAPIDFNNQKISDIIIKHATQYYINTIKGGTYETSVKNAYTMIPCEYTPNKECYKYNSSFFMPQFNIWDPLWDFNTKYGPINPWRTASEKCKQETIAKVNEIIGQVLAKNNVLLHNTKTRK